MSETTAISAAARSFCTFRAEGRLYGIEVSHLREISTHVATTPVPQSPEAVRGLANLRSRIYLVIDLRPLLGLPPAECTAESRLIILKSEVTEDLGILVDRGGDIVQVAERDIEASAETSPALTRGVCKLETELMVVLDPIAIVNEVARQIR